MDELLRRPLNLQTQNRSSSGSGLRQKLPNAEKPTELPSSRLALKAELRVVRTNRIYGILENFTVSADRIGSLFEHLLLTQFMASAHSRNQKIRRAVRMGVLP